MGAKDEADADPRLIEALGHHQAGRLAAAEKLYRRLLAERPGHGEALRLLGVSLAQRGDNEAAVALLRRAVAAAPQSTLARENLGLALKQAGDHDAAVVELRQALASDPRQASTHYNLAAALLARGETAEAVASLRRAVEIQPAFADAHDMLAGALKAEGQPAAAERHYGRAIELAPDVARYHYAMGVLLAEQGREAEALGHYLAALKRQPDDAKSLLNTATTLQGLGRLDEALDYFARALRQRPDWPEAHFDRALALLARGHLAAGFETYEWRWKCPDFPSRWRQPPCLAWRGEPLAGRRLLIWGEQGVGDQVLFATAVPDLIAAGAALVIECEARLVPLFARSFPGAEVLPLVEPLPARVRRGDIDFHCPMGDLPRYLRRGADAFPTRSGYLVPDPAAVAACRQRYGELGPGRRVGIAWRSGSRATGARRSLPLERWGPVLASPGNVYINLQYGDAEAEIDSFRAAAGIAVHSDPAIDQMASLDDFAAQIAALDLVISIANTTVHMAGALGVPVWSLVPLGGHWAWIADRDDSPWYPSMRLFRQSAPGDWEVPLAAVAAALAALDG